ncbi:putative cell differentiation protein RCD1 -like protein [Capsicum annuum]|nr:putative cell differentiation protein RCD1 -like protein [Capsicum annuum]
MPPPPPTFDVHPQVVPPYSIRVPALNIFSDQHYALEPTFKSTGTYDCPQLPEFPQRPQATEKPVMIEEQEKIARKLRSLELTMKNLQGLGGYKSVSYKDLCLFPGVHLPLGFKIPKFEKYDGHGDPVAHLRCYCNQLRGTGGKEELLMAYFGESLSDEKSLTSITKKNTESFREYAIRWREKATRVKPPMKERKILEVFIQAQDEIYYQHLLPALGKPFIEVLKMGKMIEEGIKTGRIVSFATLKATTQVIQKGSGSVGEKKNEEDASAIIVGQQERSRRPRRRRSQAQAQVYAQAPHNHSQNPLYSVPPHPYPAYNAQPHVQPSSYPQWHTPMPQSHLLNPQTYQNPSKLDFLSKPNNEMRQKSRDSFTPIGESYANLF